MVQVFELNPKIPLGIDLELERSLQTIVRVPGYGHNEIQMGEWNKSQG